MREIANFCFFQIISIILLAFNWKWYCLKLSPFKCLTVSEIPMHVLLKWASLYIYLFESGLKYIYYNQWRFNNPIWTMVHLFLKTLTSCNVHIYYLWYIVHVETNCYNCLNCLHQNVSKLLVVHVSWQSQLHKVVLFVLFQVRQTIVHQSSLIVACLRPLLCF